MGHLPVEGHARVVTLREQADDHATLTDWCAPTHSEQGVEKPIVPPKGATIAPTLPLI